MYNFAGDIRFALNAIKKGTERKSPTVSQL